MPCLSGRYDPAIGAIINVGVALAGTLVPGTNTQPRTFPALVDTGASGTCISPNVATALGVNPLGMRPMISATQAVPTNWYLVDLVVPFGGTGFVLSSTEVLEFVPISGSPFEIIIGRDIICRGSLTMSFDGHFTLSL